MGFGTTVASKQVRNAGGGGRRRRALLLGVLGALTLGLGAANAVSEKDQVFITLTRTPLDAEKLPTNVTRITRDIIERRGAQNVAEAVKSEVGSVLTQTSALGSLHQVAIRGFTSARVLVMVDDKPVRNLFTGTIDLSQIPTDNIDRIEVVRGAGSALYGPNSQGGVIHIFTKRATANTPTMELGAQTRSYGTRLFHLNFGTKAGRAEGHFSGIKNVSDGFRKNSDWDNNSFSGDMGYDFGAAGKSELDVSFTQSEVGTPGVSVHPVTGAVLRIDQFDGELEKTARSPNDRQKDKIQSLRFQHSAQKDDLIGGKVRVYGEQRDQTFVNFFGASKFESTNTAKVQGIDTQIDLPRYGFTVGSQLEQQRFQSSSVNEIVSTIWGVYAQEQQTFFDRWTVIVGVRGDRNKDYGSSVNPRVTTVLNLGGNWKVSANVGRAFNAPTFANRFSPSSNPNKDIKPETSWQYDAGLEYSLPSEVTARATYFRADVQDKIVSDSGNSFRANNLATAFSQGVELEMEQQLTTWLSHGANYTYLESLGQRENFSDFFTLPLSPKHTANYFVNVRGPLQVNWSSDVRYVDVQYFPNFDGKERTMLDPYILWGMRISKQIAQIEAFFAVDNLMDVRYATNANPPEFGGGYFAQPGRTYWGGVNVKFFGS